MSKNINEIIYPTSFQAVDIIVLNKQKKKTLLGRKPNQTLFRFIGGFVDPADPSLEYAARRELGEEAGINLEVSQPVYLGSFKVWEDTRYKASIHKVMSAVFVCEYIFGFAKGNDDIEEVDWFDFELMRQYDLSHLIVKEHLPLVRMAADKGIFDEPKEISKNSGLLNLDRY